MAFITTTYQSKALNRKVTFRALIPSPMESAEVKAPAGKPLKTIYLLHGYFGDYTDWVNNTRIHELSDKYGIAVIMPSGENSFYLDDADNNAYWGDFIGNELVEFTRSMFPLSNQREDTYIAGLSMGGYGALRNGLKHSDTFSKIACFSGAHIVLDFADTLDDADALLKKGFKQRIFGDFGELRHSDKDPRYLFEGLKEQGKQIPELLITCGEQDILVEVNRKLCAYLSEKLIPYDFMGGEGAHDWDYWNKSIVSAFSWFIRELK